MRSRILIVDSSNNLSMMVAVEKAEIFVGRITSAREEGEHKARKEGTWSKDDVN